jgi:hypothetical protein
MAQNRDLLQEAISNIKSQQIAAAPVTPEVAPAQDADVLQQALANLGQRQGVMPPAQIQQPVTPPREEGISPYITRPLKTFVGTGQELAEFVAKVPRLAGIDVGRPPKVVEPGIGEKLGAGVIEYLLGGEALKAAPIVQKGIQAVGKIPGIGRALASPMAQRAAGAAALGAIEREKEPLKGAAVGAVLSPVMELGLLAPRALSSVFRQLKLNPAVMRDTVKNEFNSFIDTTESALGLKKGQDIDKAAFDLVNSRYANVEKEAGNLYKDAEAALEDVKISTGGIKNTFDQEMSLLKDSIDTKDKRAYRSLLTLRQDVENPAKFLRNLNREKTDAYKTGNFSLINSLDNIGKDFEDSIRLESILPGNEALRAGRDKLRIASDFFKTNVVPFRKRAPVKLEAGKRKPVFTEFFKAHSADKSKGFLKKIGSNIEDLEHISRISPEINDYLSFSELKKGFNDPESFVNSFRKLTNEQKNKYFSPETLDRLDRFDRLYEEHPKIFQKPKDVTEGSLKKQLISGMPSLVAAGSTYTLTRNPMLSLMAAGVPPAARGLLGAFGRTPTARRLLMGELEKVGRPSVERPLLRGLVRGGLLGAILPTEEGR